MYSVDDLLAFGKQSESGLFSPYEYQMYHMAQALQKMADENGGQIKASENLSALIENNINNILDSYDEESDYEDDIWSDYYDVYAIDTVTIERNANGDSTIKFTDGSYGRWESIHTQIQTQTNLDGSKTQISYTDLNTPDINNKSRITITEHSWNSSGTLVSLQQMQADWIVNKKELGRPTALTNINGTSETYGMNGGLLTKTEFYGNLSNITYDKATIKSFTPEHYVEITTDVKTGQVSKVEYNNGTIQYKEFEGQRFLEKVVGVERITSVKQANGSFIILRAETINNYERQFTTKTVSYTNPDGTTANGKAIIATTVASNIDSLEYTYDATGELIGTLPINTTLINPQVNTTLYDTENKIIAETQTGGIYETKLMQNMIIDGIEFFKGDLLKLIRDDKFISYVYNEDNIISKTNTVDYNYDFLDKSKDIKGNVTENGTVTVTATTQEGTVYVTQASESYSYGLTGEKAYVDRKANTDSVVSHTGSYSESLAISNLGLDPENARSLIAKLGDDKLTSFVENITEEKLADIINSTKYTVQAVTLDFLSGKAFITEDESLKVTYDDQGLVIGQDSKAKKTEATINDVNGILATGLWGGDFSKLVTMDLSVSDIIGNKNSIDNSADAMSKKWTAVNTAINLDLTEKTSNFLTNIQVTQYERQETNYQYDALKRLTAKDYTETVNGTTVKGSVSTQYTSERKQLADGSFAISTSYTTSTTENKNGETKVKESKSGTYGYNNVGNTQAFNINLAAVNIFNATGFARDALILKRDETRNTIIAAAVTVAFVALSIVTFGAATAIGAAIALTSMVVGTIFAFTGTQAAMNALSIGDYETAALNAGFVALQFIPFLGKFISKISSAAVSATKIAKTAAEAGKALTTTQKALLAISKLVESPLAKILNGVLNPFSSPQFTATAGKFLTSSKFFSKFSGFVKIGNFLATSKAAQSILDLGIAFGRNYAVYKGILPSILNSAGLTELTSNKFFNAFTTIMVFAPIFNKRYSRTASNEEVKKSFKEIWSEKEVLENYIKKLTMYLKTTVLAE